MSRMPFRYVTVVTALTALLVLPGFESPLVLPVVLLFALTCPGLAWAHRLGFLDAGDRWAVAVAVSAALGVLVSEAMALLGVWSGRGAFLLLAAVALAGFAPPAVAGPGASG